MILQTKLKVINTFQVLSSPKARCVDSAFYFLRSVFNVNVTDIPLRHEDDFRINVPL
jgi:hypothetical protein